MIFQFRSDSPFQKWSGEINDLFWLTDTQMARLAPNFPKPHGKPRVDDRRVLSWIIFINLNGLRWRDVPEEYGPHRATDAVPENRTVG